VRAKTKEYGDGKQVRHFDSRFLAAFSCQDVRLFNLLPGGIKQLIPDTRLNSRVIITFIISLFIHLFILYYPFNLSNNFYHYKNTSKNNIL